ncbi:uncharacterized protein EI90DRAFT_3159165 [Cantharellus anzutake]|uniref:uncharacterized protein n=1 Tax=Cantharellus anzutake TaxID=1750568 RepID=UPI0019038201|nr:uncharacterized protein EI90DRAFT_3159165 [Cantharellus anzutake]KAF8315480.1 hypothetical protein EI90DRAFT_3159165 [Cantharellus anzutake]
MAKSIHSEFAEAEVGKHLSAHTLSPPTLHIMPLGKKRKQANNLGKYSQKKLHVDPSLTTESIHTTPLEHTQTVGDNVLLDWPDANVNSNSYDGANSDADSNTDLDDVISIQSRPPLWAPGTPNSDFQSPTSLPSPSPCRLPRGYPTSGSDTTFGPTPEHSGSDPNLDTFQTTRNLGSVISIPTPPNLQPTLPPFQFTSGSSSPSPPPYPPVYFWSTSASNLWYLLQYPISSS